MIKTNTGKNVPKEKQREVLLALYGDELGLDANLDRYMEVLLLLLY